MRPAWKWKQSGTMERKMGPNLGGPGVTYVCLDCETSFRDEECWVCGNPGTPSAYANVDINLAMINAYTEQNRRFPAEDESR